MGASSDIWNRGCADAGEPKTLTSPGDRALADMVLAHSLAMNGGALHAVECLTETEHHSAVLDYRHFGLQAAAEVLESVQLRWRDDLDLEQEEQVEAEADNAYALAVPEDEVLVAALEAKIEAVPDEFGPID